MPVKSSNLLNQLKNTNPMLWGTLGYLFLFIFRPFEYWTWLGDYHIERVYMICLLIALLLWRGKRYAHHPITSAFIAFFLVICFSIIIAYHPPAAIREAEEYFKLMVLFFVIMLTVKDENDFQILIIGFIAIMSFYVGKSLWEFFLHDRHTYRMGIRRLMGIDQTYSNPNSFAASIVYSLPFAWALWKSTDNRWIQIGLVGYGLISAVAITFTGSRSGFVTLILFLILAWVRAEKKLLYKILGLVGLAIFLVSAWQLVPKEYKLRYLTMIDDTINKSATESSEGRIEGLKNGFQLFVNRPLFGWGAGNFPYAVETIGVFNRMQSHNLYGQLAADLGFLGIAAFIATCWILFRTNRLIQHVTKKKERWGFGDGAIIPVMSNACIDTMILLLFQGNFGHNLYRYTWLLMGAILVSSQRLIVKQLAEESRLRFKTYQLIFFIRFRKPILVGAVASRIHDLFSKICSSKAAAMFKFRVSSDCVGMLVALPKHISISKLAKLIRLQTSQKIFSEFKNLEDEFPGVDIWERTSITPVPNEILTKFLMQQLSRKKPNSPIEGFKIESGDIPLCSLPASYLKTIH